MHIIIGIHAMDRTKHLYIMNSGILGGGESSDGSCQKIDRRARVRNSARPLYQNQNVVMFPVPSGQQRTVALRALALRENMKR